MDAKFVFKYNVRFISITFIPLFFYFYFYKFSIFSQVDTQNVAFVGTLSTVKSKVNPIICFEKWVRQKKI